MPMFEVRDLKNLPLLGLDNCDLIKLSTDIDSMKSQMFILQNNQKKIVELLLSQDSITF